MANKEVRKNHSVKLNTEELSRLTGDGMITIAGGIRNILHENELLKERNKNLKLEMQLQDKK